MLGLAMDAKHAHEHEHEHEHEHDQTAGGLTCAYLRSVLREGDVARSMSDAAEQT